MMRYEKNIALWILRQNMIRKYEKHGIFVYLNDVRKQSDKNLLKEWTQIAVDNV